VAIPVPVAEADLAQPKGLDNLQVAVASVKATMSCKGYAAPG